MDYAAKLKIRLAVGDSHLRESLIKLAGDFVQPSAEDAGIVLTDEEDLAEKFREDGLLVVGIREDSDAYFEGADIVLSSAGDFDAEAIRKAYLRHIKVPVEILRTERLIIRESAPEDYETFTRMADDNTGSYLAASAEESLDEFLAYIRTSYTFFGFGLWTVVEQRSGRVIGRCGLSPCADSLSPEGRIELGYLIDRGFRRKGYAEEACRSILDFASFSLQCQEVYARIDRENLPSMKLARKLGFEKLPAEMPESRLSLYRCRLMSV